MIDHQKITILRRAILISLSLSLFSWSVGFDFPLWLISAASLTLAAYLIGKEMRSFRDLLKMTGLFLPAGTFFWITGGSIAGIILAVTYRYYLDKSILPETICLFAVTAALIGITEELVFRGYIQESLKNLNSPFSILFSSLSHTSYKCCLFIYPLAGAGIDIGFLALWTFGAGLVFGTVRHFSKSVIPCVSAHAIFDVLVYAESASSPWWVW
jgi:membrane protease YdiL (CAAX protease family)